MSKKVERNYLEINSINDLNASRIFPERSSIQLIQPPDFQLNKFLYKNIGKKHNWVDRLIWSEKQWIIYTSNEKVKTYVLKKEDNIAGYFELIFHQEKRETEIAYLGLLKEYQNKNLGSFLLTSAIKNSFLDTTKRVWVHTCSLDHEHALNNYISRGMRVYRTESILI